MSVFLPLLFAKRAAFQNATYPGAVMKWLCACGGLIALAASVKECSSRDEPLWKGPMTFMLAIALLGNAVLRDRLWLDFLLISCMTLSSTAYACMKETPGDAR